MHANRFSRTALNLLQAYAVAVKHNLRFEPAIAYQDLIGLVGHLETFARDAHVDDPALIQTVHKTPWKAAGEYLGVSFAESNPRKLLKRAKKPLGHLPIEILNHLSTYVNHCTVQGLFPSATYEGQLSTFPSLFLEKKKLDLTRYIYSRRSSHAE
jgi:hypothetical protein